ncbi:MAG: penicillin-binding transpeptidase domain-containing protein, partial [Pseudomonadota bacterium]
NLEGVRSASLGYFGKEPRRLTPAQAALLVALPQAPERRRPDGSATRARAGRDRVLKRMGSIGLLPLPDVQAALRAQGPDRRIVFPKHAPHLADRLRIEEPARRVHHTTLDGAAQRRVERLAATALHGYQEALSLAILVVDHRTGAVLISVGSRGYGMERAEGFVDMTRAVRSPGSTLKPLIYGLAFDRGLAHPETLIDDRPMRFGAYAPQNFDRRFRGTLRIREALQASLNLPVIAVLNALGPATLLRALRQGGAHPRLSSGHPGLAIGLGGIGLTLEELVQNYASLARGGRAVRLIYRNGADATEGPRMLSPAAAWHVTDILSGAPRPPNAPSAPVALKTGTSYGHRDAWAIGYDGAHVVGVWIGRADGTPVPGIFGADVAAPLVFEVFARLNMPHVALPSAPASALTVGNADLPLPLRRFGPRGGLLDSGKPVIAFPPDGATLEVSETIFAKLQEGHAPFTWLLNGVPVISGSRARQVSLPAVPGRGYQTLVVIDAAGRSSRVTVFVD